MTEQGRCTFKSNVMYLCDRYTFLSESELTSVSLLSVEFVLQTNKWSSILGLKDLLMQATLSFKIAAF